jgi:hypothetical protein
MLAGIVLANQIHVALLAFPAMMPVESGVLSIND